jgi:hypothetical protein
MSVETGLAKRQRDSQTADATANNEDFHKYPRPIGQPTPFRGIVLAAPTVW